MDNTKKKSVASEVNVSIYATVFAKLPDFLYLLDRNCLLIDCNDNFLKLLGVKTINKTIVGAVYNTMSQHGPWSDAQTQIFKQQDIDTILSGSAQTDETELPIFDDNGNIIYFKATRIPLLDSTGEVDGLLVILRDISAQKPIFGPIKTIKKESHHAHPNEPRTNNRPLRKLAAESELQGDSEHKYQPKILLIEDSPVAQLAAKSVLMRCNCLVDVAGDESQFDACFLPGKYDLVFMDIGLENTSGYAFAKQLRKKEQDSGHKVPIIALTGFDPLLVSLDCGYYQMEGAIGKPLKPHQAKQILERYIHQLDIEVTGLTPGVSHLIFQY